MTTKRLALLLVVLLGGLSLVYALPKQLGFQPVGLRLELPERLGPWVGTPVAIQQKERETLVGTEFARMSYQRPGGGPERVLVTILLAGQDMMTGLHRPERCLNAQGWNPGGSAQGQFALNETLNLPYTRLLNTRKLAAEPGRPAATLPSICYYWFVGATQIIGTHQQRIWADMKDRVLYGYNQRWAMILVNGEVTAGLIPHGRDEAATDEAIQDVVRRFFPPLVTIKS